MNLARTLLCALTFISSVGFLGAQEDGKVAPVTFSLPDQTFTEPLVLELSCEVEDAVIRYTTDGKPLTVFNSKTYTEPIEITDTTWIRSQATTSEGSSELASAHYIRLGEDVQGFDSPLPILVLENFGQGSVPSKTWNQTGAGVKQVARQRAQWFLFDRNVVGKSSLAGEPDESARLGIRVRGAFSSSFPRKPYSVEAWDERDASTNITPLGMPAESDWILYSPNAAQDLTMLYNTWLYELSRSIGGNAVRFRFTEAFVHTGGGPLTMDDHAGVAVLMEKVKRDGNRLDFPNLAEDGSDGGWLLSINRMDPVPVDGYPAPNGAMEPQFFHTGGPNRNVQTPPNAVGRGDDIPRQGNAFFNFESPNGYAINDDQRAAIEGWFEEFEDVLYSDDFRDPETGYSRYLDVGNFIDYFILHDITRNTDGLLISMWVYKEGLDAKLKMGPVWDYDLAYKGAATSNLGLNRDRLWYTRLWQDPDFEQRYRDRWQELRAGPMSDDAIRTLIDRQASEITEPVAIAHGISNWPTRLTRWKDWLTDRAGAIDKKFEPRPKFVQPGGKVAPGSQVSLRAGTIFAPRAIYYTMDGTDPRSPGGALAEQATLLDSNITITETAQVRARVLVGEIWSGDVERWYFVGEEPASSENVQISKIHYHPSDPKAEELAAGLTNDDDFEFIELKNLTDQAIHLGGARFADGVDFNFDDHAMQILAPHTRLLLVRDRPAFEVRYGNDLPVAGEYAGRLRNSGERLLLLDVNSEVIEEFTYNDRGVWPRSADGEGPSLVRMNDPNDASGFAWRPSLDQDGAPGLEDDLIIKAGQDLIDFALGGQERPITVNEVGQDRVVLVVQRQLAASGIQLLVETSADLISWQTAKELKSLDRVHLENGLAEEWLAVPSNDGTFYVRIRVLGN